MRPTEEQTRETVGNTTRDEATVGKNQNLSTPHPGLANEDTPQWAPPETDPEPRPVEPTLQADTGAAPAQA